MNGRGFGCSKCREGATCSLSVLIWWCLQDSTLLLTPLKNNEFQVSTTNQFSYLPYQQNLLNCNKQPFARTNKLRQNFNKRNPKPHANPRPKSMDFEVLQSLENICRCQPIAYSPGLGGLPGVLRQSVHLRASQRSHQRDKGVQEQRGPGEWLGHNVHPATRVWHQLKYNLVLVWYSDGQFSLTIWTCDM